MNKRSGIIIEQKPVPEIKDYKPYNKENPAIIAIKNEVLDEKIPLTDNENKRLSKYINNNNINNGNINNSKILSHDTLDNILSLLDMPDMFINACDFQNSEGHLVFNNPPSKELYKYLIGWLNKIYDIVVNHRKELLKRPPIKKVTSYINHVFYYNNDICTIKWKINMPPETARILFRVHKNITLNCNLEFVDNLPFEIYKRCTYMVHKEAYLQINLLQIKYTYRTHYELNERFDCINGSIGDLIRWIYYKCNYTAIDNDYSNIYIYRRSCIYNIISQLYSPEQRLDAMQRYESSGLHNYKKNKANYQGQYLDIEEYYEKYVLTPIRLMNSVNFKGIYCNKIITLPDDKEDGRKIYLHSYI